jgi:hypothetical protein
MALTRLNELDALRGLMLVLMTITHLPTRLSSPLGQPFGYVSAAEGFVLLSAYMAGLVYGRTALEKSVDAMGRAFWQRAFKVYACHIAILLFLFTVIAAVGLTVDQPAVKNLMAYYLTEPWRAFLAGAALLYKPPLLDILPMYVLFMLASPWMMAWGLRHGWGGVLLLSGGLWLLAQCGLGQWLYKATLGGADANFPFRETGSFATFAWQLLWVVGLWMGASRSKIDLPALVCPRWVVGLALAVGVIGMGWRHGAGQIPFQEGVAPNVLFDKWQLGPLRLLNLVALAVLVIRFGPALMKLKPRWAFLEKLGSASLPVFCAHLLMVLLVLAFWGDMPQARPWWGDVVLLAVCFALLLVVAEISLWVDRTSAKAVKATQAARERRKARKTAAAAPAGSPAPTDKGLAEPGHSPR